MMSPYDSNGQSPMAAPSPLVVLEWIIPRPNGRWHRAFVVTSKHVWLTPEMDFPDSQALGEAAPKGDDGFREFLKGTGWINRPERVEVDAVTGIKWDKPTGWLRLAAGDEIVGGQIPNRDHGDQLVEQLKVAISRQRKRNAAE